ncbi:MAG: hypothetical protein BAJALOKI2v1_650025 [Promethearchaeota archaeon]|nr:MAG: hypothetical protein BAJALOKI2v1_650025 [Candidatus Lokiarchaeota archaeon]
MPEPLKTFKVNKYITLKLEDQKTNIYVNGKLFRICKLVRYYYDKESGYDNSIFKKWYGHEEEFIENSWGSYTSLMKGTKREFFLASFAFWVHCSNIQAWAEFGYNDKLMDNKFAFSLLKKLADEGDMIARKRISKMILDKFKTGIFMLTMFLLEEGFVKYLDDDEIDAILSWADKEEYFFTNYIFLLKEILKNGATRAGIVLKNYLSRAFNSKNDASIFETCLKEHVLNYLDEEDKAELIQELYHRNKEEINKNITAHGYIRFLNSSTQKELFLEKLPELYEVSKEKVEQYIDLVNYLFEQLSIIEKGKKGDPTGLKKKLKEFFAFYDKGSYKKDFWRNRGIETTYVDPLIKRIREVVPSIFNELINQILEKLKAAKYNFGKINHIEWITLRLRDKKMTVEEFKELIEHKEGVDFETIDALFSLFVNFYLFTREKYKPPTSLTVTAFKDKEFQEEIILPLIKMIFNSGERIQNYFYEQLVTFNKHIETEADVALMEFILYHFTSDDFIHYFGDHLERFGTIFVEIMHKYNIIMWEYSHQMHYLERLDGAFSKIGELLSPLVKEKIKNAILDDDPEYLRFLQYQQLFHLLNEEDARFIFEHPEFDVINYILSHDVFIPEEESVIEHVFDYFSEKLDSYVSDLIIDSLLKVIERANPKECEMIIKVGFYGYITPQVSKRLSILGAITYLKELILFYEMFGGYELNKYMGEVLEKGMISHLSSQYIQWLAKNDYEDDYLYISTNWFDYMNKHDFGRLWEEPHFNFVDCLLKLDVKARELVYAYGHYFEFPMDYIQYASGKIKEDFVNYGRLTEKEKKTLNQILYEFKVWRGLHPKDKEVIQEIFNKDALTDLEELGSISLEFLLQDENKINLSVPKELIPDKDGLKKFFHPSRSFGHTALINALDISSDGRYLATGSFDRTVKLWNLEHACHLRTFKGHNYAIFSVLFLDNYNLILSGSERSKINIWSIKTGRLMDSITTSKRGSIESLQYSAINDILIIRVRSYNGYPFYHEIWDFTKRKRIKQLSHKLAGAGLLQLTSDEQNLVGIGEEGHSLLIFDTTTGDLSTSFEPQKESLPGKGGRNIEIRGFTISMDGKFAYITTARGFLIKMEFPSGKIITSVQVGKVKTLREIPPEKIFLEVNNTLQLRDNRSLKLLQTIENPKERAGDPLIFTPDYKRIISSHTSIKVSELSSGKLIKTLGTAAFMCDTELVREGKVISLVGNELYYWNLQKGNLIRKVPIPSTTIEPHTSPNGRYFTTHVSSPHRTLLDVWDLDTLEIVNQIEGYFIKDYDSTGTIMACIPWYYKSPFESPPRGRVTLLKLPSGEKVISERIHHGKVSAVSISPTEKIIASASDEDNEIKIWDYETGRIIRTITDCEAISRLYFSPDGKTLVGYSRKEKFTFWDINNGEQLMILITFNYAANLLSFSHDGKYIAYSRSQNTAYVKDIKDETSYGPFEHLSRVYKLKFTDDDTHLISITHNGNVYLWDYLSQKEEK